MRVGVFLFSVILFSYLGSSVEGITGEVISTGEVIATGEAVLDNVSLSVVVADFPALSILNPENETYIRNQVFLDYLVDFSDEVWYNVDGGLNATIISPTDVFLGEGGHVINLYAKSIYGAAHKYVWFTVDSFLLDIRYDDYKGSAGGGSTDFITYNLAELENLSGVVLEQVLYGKIEFDSVINVVNDSNSSDGVVDLDANVEMSNGFIEVNVSELPNFNVSSRIYFYNLDMVTPRVFSEGVICPPDVCMNKSYVDGVYSFNVSSLGDYFVQDAYVSPSSGGGGGGGSVGVSSSGGVVDSGVLNIDFERMSISVRQGEIKTKEILLTNEGNEQLRLEVLSSGLEDLLFLESYEDIVLEPGEARSIFIDISAKENLSVDNYLGKLFFSGEGVSREVLLSVFVESMLGLFDVDVEIVQGGEIVSPGDYLVVEVSIMNLGEPKRRYVDISYFLKSDRDEVLFLEEEIGIIDTQLVLPKTFRVPEDLADGDYVLYANVGHEGRVTGGSAWFEVRSPGAGMNSLLLWLILGCLVLIVLIFLLGKKRRKRKRRRVRRVFR